MPLTKAKQITFNGWDFGGQNIYRHTHQLFFTAPAVYLAVWNPRRGPEQCCVAEWIKMVRQRAFDESRPLDRPRILVVATHGGPKERSAHIDQQLLRDEFGDLIAGFHHVDSRPDPVTGICHGLDELKAAIAREAAAIPSVGRSVPKSWKNLLDALQNRSEKDPYITYKQYLAGLPPVLRARIKARRVRDEEWNPCVSDGSLHESSKWRRFDYLGSRDGVSGRWRRAWTSVKDCYGGGERSSPRRELRPLRGPGSRRSWKKRFVVCGSRMIGCGWSERS